MSRNLVYVEKLFEEFPTAEKFRVTFSGEESISEICKTVGKVRFFMRTKKWE